MTWVEATPGAPLLIHATRYDDAPLHLHTLPCARALPQTRSPDERDPRAHKGNVPALRLPHIISRKKMHIGRDPAQVAIELPLGTELGRRGDVACAASRRQGQVARRAVDTIPPRVPPEHVAPERYEDVVAWQQLQGGVDVNEVARADDAGVIKIARLKPTVSPVKSSLVYFISIAYIDHPVWRSHREEAKRGPPSGHRIPRIEGAMMSLLLRM